jgi:hypothetical protein
MTNETNDARDQAIAQAQSIAALVAALDVDYDRLQELREERESLTEDTISPVPMHRATEAAKKALREWEADNLEELAELEEAAGECNNEDEARERIQEDALSVEVRSEWHSPGDASEAGEFRIVLCTGGPHVEIRGELRDGEPHRAWIAYRDWGTSGELTGQSPAPSIEQDTLLRYCGEFFAS